MMQYMTKASLVAALLLSSAVQAQDAADLRFTAPTTISPEARAMMLPALAMQAKTHAERVAVGKDIPTARANAEKGAAERMPAIAERYAVTATPGTLGGTAVLRIVPRNAAKDGRVLVYVHGGGWAAGSARSSFRTAAIFAAATGLTVVSVDYGLAPEHDFRDVTGEVASVYRALLAAGHKASQIGLFGDSAGGNIILGTTLRLRDEGQALPAALVALSPCTDLSGEGDSRLTLADVDPALDAAETLAAMRVAYAGKDTAAGMLHSWASPVRGDYRLSFPPTLIQGGTRELLLSDFVRQYQVMRGAGREAVLDLYEGMPHVFMSYLADAPEGKQAIATARDFLLTRLAES